MRGTSSKLAAAGLLGMIGIIGAGLLVIPVRGTILPTAGAAEAQAGHVKRLRVPNKGIQPQVAVDGKGVLHLIYFGGDPRHGDIFYVRSTDEGATFSRPLQVNSVPGSAIAIGNIRGAQMAVGKNGRVHVAWNEVGKKSFEEAGMLYARLNDTGTAFEPQRNVIQAAYRLDGGGSVAADDAGNVYVVWHAPQPDERGEKNRRVWVARSTDEGKSFSHEQAAFREQTGACGCCGLRAFADSKGGVYVLYRSAKDETNRDTYLLTSTDKGASFRGEDVHSWKVPACPMSSFGFAEGPAGSLATWETNGQVYFAPIDPETGKHLKTIAAPGQTGNRKHSVVACNKRGQTILAWAEGVGWERGGSVVWQVFDKDGKPTAEKGRADGVAIWSLVAVFARPDGGFTVVY